MARAPEPSSSTPPPGGFKCSICAKILARQGDMPRHMKTHMADKNKLMHRCPVAGCPFQNLQKKNVQTHIKIHTGNKSECCPDCDFKTSDPGSLTRHRKRFHNYIPQRRRARDNAKSPRNSPSETSTTMGTSSPSTPSGSASPDPGDLPDDIVLLPAPVGPSSRDYDEVLLPYHTSVFSVELGTNSSSSGYSSSGQESDRDSDMASPSHSSFALSPLPPISSSSSHRSTSTRYPTATLLTPLSTPRSSHQDLPPLRTMLAEANSMSYEQSRSLPPLRSLLFPGVGGPPPPSWLNDGYEGNSFAAPMSQTRLSPPGQDYSSFPHFSQRVST
ncbi:hypothetical protein C8J56DRAFT_922890 [Mycena floridula]|nr:hypothetical protein C8J56DRAFT_922890 [Mycena floridula]